MKVLFECSICGQQYTCAEDASKCESKGACKSRISFELRPWEIGQHYISISPDEKLECFKIIKERIVQHTIYPVVTSFDGRSYILAPPRDENLYCYMLIDDATFNILRHAYEEYHQFIHGNEARY